MKVGFDFDNTILNYDKVFAYLSKWNLVMNLKNLIKVKLKKNYK